MTTARRAIACSCATWCCPCSIGIYPREKGLRRRVRINVQIHVTAPLPRSDDFADVVNYETIVAGIETIAEGGHINLVETLADGIADCVLPIAALARRG